MTVKELIDQLLVFEPHAEVTACWDSIPSWQVRRVIAYNGRAVLDVDSFECTAEDMARFDGLNARGPDNQT